MEYIQPFEHEFIVRTLKVVEQYDNLVMPNVPADQQFEVTLLVNCLLGLLVLPKEHCYANIPAVPLAQLQGWSIEPRFIQSWGNSQTQVNAAASHTLKDVVHRMRNSVAHLRVRPQGNGTDILELEFSDQNGFHAVVPVSNLKLFVTKLAQSV